MSDLRVLAGRRRQVSLDLAEAPVASPWLGYLDAGGKWRCGVCHEVQPAKFYACDGCAARLLDERFGAIDDDSRRAWAAKSQTQRENADARLLDEHRERCAETGCACG